MQDCGLNVKGLVRNDVTSTAFTLEIAIFIRLGVGGVSEIMSLDHGLGNQNTSYSCIHAIGTIGYDIWLSHYMGPNCAAYCKRPHWYFLFFDIFVLGPWLGLVMYLHH